MLPLRGSPRIGIAGISITEQRISYIIWGKRSAPELMNLRLRGFRRLHLDTFSSHCEKCTHIYVLAALMLLIKPYLLAAIFFSTGSLTFMSVHSSRKKM